MSVGQTNGCVCWSLVAVWMMCLSVCLQVCDNVCVMCVDDMSVCLSVWLPSKCNAAVGKKGIGFPFALVVFM